MSILTKAEIEAIRRALHLPMGSGLALASAMDLLDTLDAMEGQIGELSEALKKARDALNVDLRMCFDSDGNAVDGAETSIEELTPIVDQCDAALAKVRP